MVHHMYDGNWSGWDVFWMVPMMLLWVVAIGGIVYAAIRLAIRHEREQRPS